MRIGLLLDPLVLEFMTPYNNPLVFEFHDPTRLISHQPIESFFVVIDSLHSFLSLFLDSP